MNRYENYKEVDLPWLKEVPSHWEIKKIRHIFEERKEKNVNGKEKFVLSVLKGIGVIPYSEKGSIGNKASENIENYKIVYKDDIVLNSMNMMIGSLGKSSYKGVLSHVYYVLKLNQKEEVDINYLEYVFKNSIFYESFRVLGKGILDHRLRVPMEALKYEHLPLPSLQEQRQIANYLDWKINEIDKLIAKEKEKIRELEILKNSVTNNLLDIKTGKKIKIKHFCNLYGRIGWQGLTSSEYSDEGILLVTGTDFKNGEIDFKTCVRVPYFRWEQNKNIQLKNNDLLITKDGTVGKLAIVKNLEEKATLNSGIMKIEFFNDCIVTKEFLYYILKSDVFKNWFYNLNLGVATIIHLYQRDFYNFEFVYPDINTQNILAKKIKEIEFRFDKTINDVKNQIQNLESLKQSLISEVVTGQIDVRDVVIPKYEKFTLEINFDLEEEVVEDA